MHNGCHSLLCQQLIMIVLICLKYIYNSLSGFQMIVKGIKADDGLEDFRRVFDSSDSDEGVDEVDSVESPVHSGIVTIYGGREEKLPLESFDVMFSSLEDDAEDHIDLVNSDVLMSTEYFHLEDGLVVSLEHGSIRLVRGVGSGECFQVEDGFVARLDDGVIKLINCI